MTAQPEITVCIPVYQRADLVGDTLASIARQTHDTFRVLISVDPSTDGSLELCRQWERDPRFRVVAQPSRLGWPGNVNWLLRQVTTPRLCIMPHDDWVEPDYLARLAAALDESPGAAIAYCDIVIERDGSILTAEPLNGDPCARVCAFLLHHLNGVQWRGLIRTEAALATNLHECEHDGFAADTLWLLALAAFGDFVRVPNAIYHKRYPLDSVTAGWDRWRKADLDAHLLTHHANCLLVALAARPWTEEERHAIAAAAAVRAATSPGLSGTGSTAELIQRVGDFILRAAGAVPSRSPAPNPASIPPDLANEITDRLGWLEP